MSFEVTTATVLLLSLFSHSYAGQQCLSCSGVEGSDDCQHITTCNADEVCVMHNYVNETGSVLYDLGCSLNQGCHHSMDPIFGRRSEGHHVKCTICCNSTRLCNQDLTCTNMTHIPSHLPRECADVKKDTPSAVSGVHTIYPYGTEEQTVLVFCKFDASGLAWTIIQRRYNGSVDFYRNWQAYKEGFGSPYGEYWLGNDVINELTSHTNHDLRIEMSDFEGVSKYAEYTLFNVGDEDNGYKLTAYNYSGNAGDSLQLCGAGGAQSAHGMQFTTYDKDNDQHAGENCAVLFKGSWWYNACHCSNLNGKYLAGQHDTYADGIQWKTWHGQYYSLRSVDMMIRKY